MRILFVITNSALNRRMNTGLENLAWGLAERGLELHILSGGNAPDSHDYILSDNVYYHFTGASGENPVTFLPLFRRIVEKHRIDAVVGWIINTALLARESCAKDIIFLANLGQMPPRSIALRFMKAALLGKIRLADAVRLIDAIRSYPKVTKAVISNSQAVETASVPKYRLAANRCLVVHRGIDSFFYAYSERSIPLGTPIEILFVGNIHDAKGVGELAEAMTLIEYPLCLRLCGRSNPDYIDALKGIVEPAGHQLAYMGPQSQDNLVSYYQQCDIFAFPSHSEGLPKVLLEAMSCGCPVVCSDIMPHREIVQNGHNGLMASVRSSKAIAGAIEQYIKEPSLRKHCSENARKTVDERFSKQHEIDGWIKILQDAKK